MAQDHHHDEPVHEVHDGGSGFGSGVLLALLILIVVVAILLLFNFGPSVFNVNVRITSWIAPLLSMGAGAL